MQSHWNSEAGSHETRGEVIFVQQDSTRNLIQFSIAFSIKTWNCFPEFNGPLTAQATLVTNHCELTFRKPRRLSYLQIQSDVIFQLFFCYVVNLLSRAGSYSTTSVTRDRTIFENRIRCQLQQFATIRMTLIFLSHFLELEEIIVIICNSSCYWSVILCW